MQGTVLKFDGQTNKGIISGHDGNRYNFVRMDWTSDKEPREGQSVDFETEEKDAKEIIVLSPSTSKDKKTTALLALFLGGAGVHKFYLSQTGQGILYLVFMLTGIPALIGFIEAILYFKMSEEEFAKKYAQ